MMFIEFSEQRSAPAYNLGLAFRSSDISNFKSAYLLPCNIYSFNCNCTKPHTLTSISKYSVIVLKTGEEIICCY